MWEDQVGLYNDANMGLLKIVFEEHLSLYGNLDGQYVGFASAGFEGLTNLFYQPISVAKNNFCYSS